MSQLLIKQDVILSEAKDHFTVMLLRSKILRANALRMTGGLNRKMSQWRAMTGGYGMR